MRSNYHTHTFRCGHAKGTPEEYIQRAVENGITHMGFSDHFPIKLSDGTESRYRVPVAEGKIYCEEIRDLAEKYKGQIDIKVGFEMEYYSERFDEMLKNAREYGAEYLILGQHYTRPEDTTKKHSTFETDSAEDLKNYVESIIEAMQTRVFTFVAHPDIFNFVGDTQAYKEEMRKICIASREMNIPLEINFWGIRTHRNYPNDAFWQIAGEEKSPVVFGFDAHDVLSAFDGETLEKAKEMVEKYNLNYLEKPEVILI